MSLVRFSAKNHPQQVARSGARDDVDDRETPVDLFRRLDDRFHFTLDAAASNENAKCIRYFTLKDNGLTQPWANESVWCNPPYSDISAWVMKAWNAWELEKTRQVVMLLPANRTEQGWWQRLVEPYRERGSFHVEFLAGRLRFARPSWTPGPKGDRPPFGSCLLIWGPK